MSELEKETEPVSDLVSAASIPALLVEEEQRGQDGTLYKYRDFSSINEEEEDLGEIPPPTPGNRGNMESSIRVQKFPVKLYAILAQKEFHDIITWMPHGRAWKVLKPSMFESMVMPLFFEYSNYHSFNRLVNAWSFRRVSSGPDRGSYYHELFLRGKPQLQKYMRRLPKTHKKLPMKKEDEPDFYALDKSNPLPALEDAPIPGAAATTMAMNSQAQQMRSGHMMGGHGVSNPGMMGAHNMEMMKHHHRQNGFHQHQQQPVNQQSQGGLQSQLFNPDPVVSHIDEFDVGQPMNFRDQQFQRGMRGGGVSPPQLGQAGSNSYGLPQMSGRMRQDQHNNGMRQPQPFRPSPHHQMEPINPDMFSDQPLGQNHMQSAGSQGNSLLNSSQHHQQPDELFHYQQQMKLQRMNQPMQHHQGNSTPPMHSGMFQERNNAVSKASNQLVPEDFRPRSQRPQC